MVKKRAKAAFPKETFAYVLGHDAGTLVEVVALWWPEDVDQYATTESVQVPPRWLGDAQDYAKDLEVAVIGDVHSHCWMRGELGRWNPGAAPSEWDMEQGQLWLTGICNVVQGGKGRKTAEMRWWGPLVPVVEVKT